MPSDIPTKSHSNTSDTLYDGRKAGTRNKFLEVYNDDLPVHLNISFFHQELKETRNTVAKEWLRTTAILCVFIICVISLFLGAFMHVEENLPVMTVWVVNFDGVSNSSAPSSTLVGPFLTNFALNTTKSPGHHITFESVSPTKFHNNPDAVRQAIYEDEAWAAIIIMPDATSNLRNAIDQGDSSYDPTSACEIVYVSARDQSSIETYITPALASFQTKALSMFGSRWTAQLLASGNVNTTALAAVPQALSPAIGFTDIDLRPFRPPQAQPGVTVCLIYLVIIAFFSYSFFLPTHTHFISQMEGHRKVLFHHLLVWKYLSTLCAYFWMSFSYSVVFLMFQIPFNHASLPGIVPATDHNANAYHHGSFLVYWLVNFLGMCALGFACENMAMILGQPWTALWLIFWVIANVSTSFYPVVLAPAFYSYGYAFPLYSVVQATRIVMFDVSPKIGLPLGILCAWWAVNTAVFPLAAWWLRHVRTKEVRREWRQKRGGGEHVNTVMEEGGRVGDGDTIARKEEEERKVGK